MDNSKICAVAVYCGSNHGTHPAFTQAAAGLGRTLAERGIRLVYGGGHVGLMGAVADAALTAGGEVHGVITRALQAKELAHQALTSLAIVETMHERKAAMADAADAFVMLPGGYGTFDEFFEVVTWTQLGIHAKPCGVLDAAGYFAPLTAMLDAAASHGFVSQAHRGLIITEADPVALLDRLTAWTPVTTDKWLDPVQRLPPAGDPRPRALHRRGSTGSDSSASTPKTHSCTRHSGSPRATRSRASRPSEYSRSASDRFRPTDRLRSRARLAGVV